MQNVDDAIAAIAAAEKVLAAERIEPLTALLAKIQASNLKEIAADLRALKPLTARSDDQQVFENFASTAESFEQLVANALKVSQERVAAT